MPPPAIARAAGETLSCRRARRAIAPGAMARLGTRTPGGPTFELHQGDLVVDESAVLVAAKVLAATWSSTMGS